jgi:ribonuclease-3
MPSLDELEEIIGYRFKNRSLLKLSLTHSSMRYEQGYTQDNQRLEFLGDAVVQLLISDILFRSLPTSDEGALTTRRASLVSSKSMADVAKTFNLGAYLKMARSEEHNGGRSREAALADVLESLIGAVYLDGGLDHARATIEHLFATPLKNAKSPDVLTEFNPKGRLQEIIQDHTNILPNYKITHEAGPDHNKHFLATVTWDGHLLGEGMGPSKKDAESAAASSAIQNPNLLKIVLFGKVLAQKPTA